jgi:hypothetical protein
MDEATDLANKTTLYNNGALDVFSLMEAHGYDPDVIIERLRAQQKLAGEKIFVPAFEQKQGITAEVVYDLSADNEQWMPDKNQSTDAQANGGRPQQTGSKPQAEAQTGRQPRPSAGKKR